MSLQLKEPDYGKEQLLSWIIKKIKEFRLPAILINPSNPLLIIILVAIAIFILGGGVYDWMENPISVLPTPSNPYFYYPGITDQTLTESELFIVFLIIGAAGGLVTFRSTRHAYRPREAQMLLLIGLAMIVVAFLGCENIMARKGV